MNLNPVFCCCFLLQNGIQASAFDYFSFATVRRCLLLLLLKCCGVKCCCFVLLLEKYFYGDLLIYSLGCCDVLLRERERKKRKHRIVRRITACFLAACLYKIFYCIYSCPPSNRAVLFVFHQPTSFTSEQRHLFFFWLVRKRENLYFQLFAPFF